MPEPLSNIKTMNVAGPASAPRASAPSMVTGSSAYKSRATPSRTSFPAYGPQVQVKPLPHRSLSGPISMTALFVTDAVTLMVTAYAVRALRTILIGEMPLTPAFIACGVLWMALRYFAALYPGYGLSGPEVLKRSTKTTALAALGHISLLFAIKMATASRFIALGTWVVLVPAAWVTRELVQRILIRFNLFGQPAVILGAGETGAYLIRELQQNRMSGIVPVAVFDDDPSKQGKTVEGVPVVGPIAELSDWVAPYSIRQAIVAIPRSGHTRLGELAHKIGHRFPQVSIVSDMLGLGTLWANTQVVGTYSMLQVNHDRFDRRNRIVKRGFDLVFGVPLFLASVPVILVAAVLVKFFSPGKAFYSQPREGVGGKRVKVWKIRTMVPDADAKLEELLNSDRRARLQWEERMKLDKDPRIVPHVGTFFRKASIDELPQLWNVIKGEMSLVGPRPFPDYHLKRFPDDFRSLRHQVPPGITGYWQITHRSEASLHDQQATDIYYIHNWSLWLDLWILFRTVGAVVKAKGAR